MHRIVEKLNMDFAPADTSMFVSEDLAPAEFFLFQKPKTSIKGKRFDPIEEIKKNETGDDTKNRFGDK